MNNVLIVLTVILASVLTQWVSLTQGNRYICAVSSKEKIRNKCFSCKYDFDFKHITTTQGLELIVCGDNLELEL